MSPLKWCCSCGYFNTIALFHWGGIFSWICLFANRKTPTFTVKIRTSLGEMWMCAAIALDHTGLGTAVKEGGEEWGWQRRRKKKNLWVYFDLNEKDFMMFCWWALTGLWLQNLACLEHQWGPEMRKGWAKKKVLCEFPSCYFGLAGKQPGKVVVEPLARIQNRMFNLIEERKNQQQTPTRKEVMHLYCSTH